MVMIMTMLMITMRMMVKITLKSQTTLPLVNLFTSTVTSSTCSAMSPSLKSLDLSKEDSPHVVLFYAKQHLSSISFKLPSIVFAKASNSGLSGSLRLAFHSLTLEMKVVVETMMRVISLSHHLELPADFVFIEHRLLLLDDRVDEVVTVGGDCPHLAKQMKMARKNGGC